MALKDMTGLVFGRLTVEARGENTADGTAQWRCRCECGSQIQVWGPGLRRGDTRSCGCLQKEKAKESALLAQAASRKHGHSVRRTPEYMTWGSMKARCQNPRHPQFKNYGARGISVCERWQSFENFLADMGERPTREHSLEREDNTRGYEPGNVVWATSIEQNNNTRANRIIEIDGRRMTVAQAIRERGLNNKTVRTRLHRGWTLERALK